jgi:acetyl esterase/lipase
MVRAPRLPAGVEALRDLEYSRPDDRPLMLDLYVPEEGPRPRPVVLWVHGGAWRSGSKERCPALWLTRHGYAVASINYRLSGVAQFPAQIHDVKTAIRWLRAQAQKYELDPERVGAWGSSAGGHLVALLGTSDGVEKLEGKGGHADQSSRVQAVCDFFGPTDFLQMDAHSPPGSPITHDASSSPESLLIGGPIREHPDEVARANPITWVDRDDPPFLILHGDRDPLVPLHQSQLLHAALAQAGVDVTLHVVEGAGHGFGGPDIERRVLEFFDRHLQLAD